LFFLVDLCLMFEDVLASRRAKSTDINVQPQISGRVLSF
jgi:hypothetical protein